MRIEFSLHLPRDASTIPVVRHVARDALEELGVEDECVGDIELAVTEACTNVVRHAATASEQYEVNFEIDERKCEVRVVDIAGADFDHAGHGLVEAATSAEGGRGIHLMRALVDDLKFISRPQDGTVVHLEKQLQCRSGSILGRLRDRASA